jgi:hypothetical protein
MGRVAVHLNSDLRPKSALFLSARDSTADVVDRWLDAVDFFLVDDDSAHHLVTMRGGNAVRLVRNFNPELVRRRRWGALLDPWIWHHTLMNDGIERLVVPLRARSFPLITAAILSGASIRLVRSAVKGP